jgi:hypothetical protein
MITYRKATWAVNLRQDLVHAGCNQEVASLTARAFGELLDHMMQQQTERDADTRRLDLDPYSWSADRAKQQVDRNFKRHLARVGARFWSLYRKNLCRKACWFVKTFPEERFLGAVRSDSVRFSGELSALGCHRSSAITGSVPGLDYTTVSGEIESRRRSGRCAWRGAGGQS